MKLVLNLHRRKKGQSLLKLDEYRATARGRIIIFGQNESASSSMVAVQIYIAGNHGRAGICEKETP